MTSFIYNTTTLTMSQDPLAPRDFEENQSEVVGYDSAGNAYAYDCSSPIYRTESLIFPAIDLTELNNLINFIQSTLDGSYNIFTWLDRIEITRTGRYKDMSFEQIANGLFKVILTLEVLS